jgi:rhamnose utilization protein RhaD (predicted bifunctional aldolase and dehydrogenase)
MSVKPQASQLRELDALRELSTRLGRNPLLAQASSGNTSIKMDDVLWIKASGKWLIQADAEDFLVPVPLAETRRGLQENGVTPGMKQNSQGRADASIETSMHAALPYKVVIHVHSVNTIAWAVREDGPQQVSVRLAGLPWQWIPYTPSGPSLARKVERALACVPETQVFVLGNHGLVVGGHSCCAAEHLLGEVEQRLASRAQLPHRTKLGSGKSWLDRLGLFRGMPWFILWPPIPTHNAFSQAAYSIPAKHSFYREYLCWPPPWLSRNLTVISGNIPLSRCVL